MVAIVTANTIFTAISKMHAVHTSTLKILMNCSSHSLEQIRLVSDGPEKFAHSRLEQLVQEAGVLASRAMIAEAVNVIVYMEKVGTKRLVRQISEVRGFTESRYELQGLVEV